MIKKIFWILFTLLMAISNANGFNATIHKDGCVELIRKGSYTSFNAQQCAELDEVYSVMRGSRTMFDFPHYVEDLSVDTDAKINERIDHILLLMKAGYVYHAIHLVQDLAQPDHVVWTRYGGKFSYPIHERMDNTYPLIRWDGKPSRGDLRENIRKLMISSALLRDRLMKENRKLTSKEAGLQFDFALSICRQMLDEYKVR